MPLKKKHPAAVARKQYAAMTPEEQARSSRGPNTQKAPATEESRAEGSEHAVAQSAKRLGGDAARGELFAGLVRLARLAVAQKAKKTKSVRRRAAKKKQRKD